MQNKMKLKYQVHFIKEIVRSLEHAAQSLTRNKSLSAPPELEVVPGAIRPQSEMELSVRLHFYHQRRQLLSILSKSSLFKALIIFFKSFDWEIFRDPELAPE